MLALHAGQLHTRRKTAWYRLLAHTQKIGHLRDIFQHIIMTRMHASIMFYLHG